MKQENAPQMAHQASSAERIPLTKNSTVVVDSDEHVEERRSRPSSPKPPRLAKSEKKMVVEGLSKGGGGVDLQSDVNSLACEEGNNSNCGRASSYSKASNSAEENGRERLKRHRVEMAGRVWIPDIWGQEDFLKDWIDCSAFDACLGPNGLMSARASLIDEARRATSGGLRIENRC